MLTTTMFTVEVVVSVKAISYMFDSEILQITLYLEMATNIVKSPIDDWADNK